MRTFLVAGMALAAVSLASCGKIPGFGSAAANNAPANVPAAIPAAVPAAAVAQPAAAVTPEAPAHHWYVQQNGAYGYTAAAATGDPGGQTAQDVVMLRYAGFKDGYDTLISTEGGYMAAQCARPCQVIVVTDAHRQVRHVALDPASIIGEAFADAQAGQLDASIAMPTTAPAPAAASPPRYQAPPAAATPATPVAQPYTPQTAAPYYAPPQQRFFRPGWQRPHPRRPYMNREGGYVDPNAAG